MENIAVALIVVGLGVMWVFSLIAEVRNKRRICGSRRP